MPRSFLVKKKKRQTPHSDLEHMAINDAKRHKPCNRSSFIAFSTSITNIEGCSEAYSRVIKPSNMCHPSSSCLKWKEAPRRKLEKVHRFQSVSAVYTDPEASRKIEIEKENVETIKSNSLSDVASVKGPLSKSNFLCQLCKKLFQDAFSLAQHKCSGIKHIEHRCPECNKVFNCPANLASHRRWHRPRSLGSNKPMNIQKEGPTEEAKMSNSKENFKEDSNQSISIRYEDKINIENNKEETCEEISGPINDRNNNTLGDMLMKGSSASVGHICDYCGKSFKRQAYLRKHIIYHSKEKPYTSHYSGKINENQKSSGKHVENAHNEEMFSCSKCFIAFHSLLGLERHLNKTHQFISKT